MTANQADTIRNLNDQFRSSFFGGKVFITPGVHCLSDLAALFDEIRKYNSFDDGNDPHQEHDFGSIHFQGETVFWKIEYYNRDLTAGSEDPSDPTVTARTMTLMLSSEY